MFDNDHQVIGNSADQLTSVGRRLYLAEASAFLAKVLHLSSEGWQRCLDPRLRMPVPLIIRVELPAVSTAENCW
jgi:hypothetical protein